MKCAQVLGVMLLSLASGYFFTVTSVTFPFKVINYFFLLWLKERNPGDIYSVSVSSLLAAMDNLLLSVRLRLLIFAVSILRILTPGFIETDSIYSQHKIGVWRTEVFGTSAMASWLLVHLNLLILGPLLILFVAPIWKDVWTLALRFPTIETRQYYIGVTALLTGSS